MYDDLQLNLDADLVTSDSPIMQPLRIIVNNQSSYLRRYSTAATRSIDAELNFPDGLAATYIPTTIGVVGSAPVIYRVYADAMNIRGDVYTSGDVLEVFVEFNLGVTITLGGVNMPFFYLDVGRPIDSTTGRTEPGVAYYASALDANTLTFEYTVTSADNLTAGGLYLYCGCEDYFDRSFISLGVDAGTSIKQTSDNTVAASLIIASSEATTDRLIESDLVIDNTVPLLVSISVNTSTGVYSAGSAIVIYLTFSENVTIVGLTQLLLGAYPTSCTANYFAGSNTETLEYLYIASGSSGTSALECDSISAIRYLSEGSGIYRYSQAPSILVDSAVFRPGTFESLGVRSGGVAIDTSEIQPYSFEVLNSAFDASSSSSNSDTIMVTPMESFTISSGADDLYRVIEQKLQEDGQVRFKIPSNSLSNLTAILESRMNSENLYVEVIHDSTVIDTVFVSNKLQLPFDYLPDFVSGAGATPFVYSHVNKQWWSKFLVQSHVDILVHYDREVVSDHVSLALQGVYNSVVQMLLNRI